jgi:hypothetical protein
VSEQCQDITSQWLLRSSSESAIRTLVNRDTMLKLTIKPFGCTCRDSNIWTNWEEFFYVVCRSPAKYLESSWVGAPMLLTMRIRRTPSLYIDGKSPRRKHTTFRTWQKFEIHNTPLKHELNSLILNSNNIYAEGWKGELLKKCTAFKDIKNTIFHFINTI